MSIHPSLAISQKSKKQKSVLKRAERIRYLMEKGLWKEGDRVYGLPKIKNIKFNIKKEKVAKTEAAGTAGAAAPAEAKGQASAKPAGQGKPQDKK